MMLKIIVSPSVCTNIFRFEHKFTRREFSQQDFHVELLLHAKTTSGDNYMSVILKQLDKFDTMKNTKCVLTHISGTSLVSFMFKLKGNFSLYSN